MVLLLLLNGHVKECRHRTTYARAVGNTSYRYLCLMTHPSLSIPSEHQTWFLPQNKAGGAMLWGLPGHTHTHSHTHTHTLTHTHRHSHTRGKAWFSLHLKRIVILKKT